jgi:hypothetical protein
VMGFCMAPMEALVPATIGDIWFLHERGFRNAIYNLGVLGGINLASPIGTFIIRTAWCCDRHKANHEHSRSHYSVRVDSNCLSRHGCCIRSSTASDCPFHARDRIPSTRCLQHRLYRERPRHWGG